MKQWYLPTLSEVVSQDEPLFQPQRSAAQHRVRAEREWAGAIAALNLLLHRDLELGKLSDSGIILSGPVPVLGQRELQRAIATWTFTASPLWSNTWMPFRLLPSADREKLDSTKTATVPLIPSDPLSNEQFCLVVTPRLSLVMVLGETADKVPAFLYSFDPEVITRSWQALRIRLLLTGSSSLKKMERLMEAANLTQPDYRIVSEFNRLMLTLLPEPMELEEGSARISDRFRIAEASADAPFKEEGGVDASQNGHASKNGKVAESEVAQPSLEEALTQSESFDTELLQAIAHEVRTPLTTIRTLTRLLLKRKDLSPDVLKRLAVIDQECTEQIDRFNLIFRAVELQQTRNDRPLTPLAPISLTQLFQQHVPRWEQLASQRNLSLDVVLPQKLPMVVTDPTMLDQVLTGLLDRITQTLPPRSHIQVDVTLAGHQLKLQFQSQVQEEAVAGGNCLGANQPMTPLKSLGQLLMFQPETGSLSLNLAVTKNLFQALGGKLIVRQRPQQGEVLTIFLPLETRPMDEMER